MLLEGKERRKDMLKINQLKKAFGSKQVLFGLNFEVKEGRILGLIGKNGAGKTTIFHSILNFIDYEGEVTWQGKALTQKDYNKIGYLPEERSLMPKLTVERQVGFLAQLKGMPRDAIKEELPHWMERLAVKGKLSDKIKSLSKGNQQKVQLIATLIHRPQLIILDEPFSGLDPVNVDLMKKEILVQKKRGATIIFSEHNMRNVEELCDDVVMIKEGGVALQGSVNAVRNHFGLTRLFVRTTHSVEEIRQLSGVEKVEVLNDGKYYLHLHDADDGKALFSYFSQGDYVQTFDQEPPTLNEIFRLKAGDAS